DGCEIRRPRSRADAGTPDLQVETGGPSAVAIASPGCDVAGIDAAGTAAARADRWPVEDGVDELPVPVCQRQRRIERMGDALLDRLPPVALRLHLEMAGAGVDIGAGADLEPVSTLLDVIAVEPEIGCVEIGGAVLEAVLAVDLEDPEVLPSRREEVDEEPAREEVLPIDAGHQPRLGVDLIEGDRCEPLQLG